MILAPVLFLRCSGMPLLFQAPFAIGAYFCHIDQFNLFMRNWYYPPQSLLFNCFCHTHSHLSIVGKTAICVRTLPLNIDNYNAYVKLLINGQTSQPFNVHTYPPGPKDIFQVQQIKDHSSIIYGQPREEVEAEIQARYNKEQD